MAINVSVQNNGFLPDIILLTQCYYHRGTRLNAMMKRFCICSLSMIPPTKRFDIFPLTGNAQKVWMRSNFYLNNNNPTPRERPVTTSSFDSSYVHYIHIYA